MVEQFVIDCGLMAGVAYESSRSDKNKFPMPNGWEKTALWHRENPASGFETVSFVNGNQIVISFTGTNGAGDKAADVALFAGFSTTQLFDAAKYYLQIKSLYPNANITFTGHSLGGGLAALMAVFFDKNAVAFDQAPFERAANLDVAVALKNYLINAFPANTYPQISDWLAPLNSYINSYGDLFSSRENNVTNINVLYVMK